MISSHKRERLNLVLDIVYRARMTHTLPKGYIVYNLDYIPDYVFEPYPPDEKPDGRNFLRLHSDTLIESEYDIDLRTDHNEFQLAPGKYFFDRLFFCGFQGLYLKEPQKHVVKHVCFKESLMNYFYLRILHQKYPIVLKNLKVISNNTITDDYAFSWVGLFGAESHDSIIARAQKHSYKPVAETESEIQDESKWVYRTCIFDYNVKTISNDPDVYNNLKWRPSGYGLSDPPCVYIEYEDRKYEALRDVLATKYGINLKRKSGFVTRQYRKRTTDELNEEIAGLWDDIKKAEHAGFISFVPVITE
jgi:hypothetical protein